MVKIPDPIRVGEVKPSAEALSEALDDIETVLNNPRSDIASRDFLIKVGDSIRATGIVTSVQRQAITNVQERLASPKAASRRYEGFLGTHK
jgi:hypothetical protein